VSRFLIVLGLAALSLAADDFWAKKPYTEWSEKDAARLLTNSPWSHDVVVVLEGAMANRSGGGRGGHGSTGGVNTGDMSPMSGSAGGSGEVTGGARAASPESMANGNGPSAASMTLHVRWQSALPIREALVLTKLGRDEADSDQARKFTGQPMPYYVVAVAGVPPAMIARISDDHMPELAKTATLLRKDKTPVGAEGAQKIAGEPGAVAFLFPKAAAITLDDKEVEFVSKVGRLEVKRKFKLKDMVIGAKLEL
jgi:hypothetical protein